MTKIINYTYLVNPANTLDKNGKKTEYTFLLDLITRMAARIMTFVYSHFTSGKKWAGDYVGYNLNHTKRANDKIESLGN